MRYIVLSDIHGNSSALRVVLEHANQEPFDGILLLGDLIGYGAQPNEVVEMVRALPEPTYLVRGNHDKVACGLEDGKDFNQVALAAARWTEEHLTPENLEFVRRLPRGPLAIGANLAICHGAPHNEDVYLFAQPDALDAFQAVTSAVTFFGHTHLPAAFFHDGTNLHGGARFGTTERLALAAGRRYLINPGSVGQPRDHDPRAAYLIYETLEQWVEWRRVQYSIAEAQAEIKAARLPVLLAERLALGV